MLIIGYIDPLVQGGKEPRSGGAQFGAGESATVVHEEPPGSST